MCENFKECVILQGEYTLCGHEMNEDECNMSEEIILNI